MKDIVDVILDLKRMEYLEDAEKIKKSTVEDSRMKFITDEKRNKIANFLFNYAYVDKKYNIVVVPIFRVLDALIQDGEPYTEE